MKTYSIKTIPDILNIPKEKLDLFLNDFKVYLHSLYFLKETNQFPENFETEIEWIDDGKNDLNIVLEKSSKPLDNIN